MYQLHLGDCLDVLPTLGSGSVDAVIADPPYSSGGFTRGDRMGDPAKKYEQSGVINSRLSFSGDNRDQRSWEYWVQMWLSRSLQVLKPSGYALVFCDWRQLPTATDAFQSGGFQWRGIIAWDKGLAARAPHVGYFRHQCEYIVWGTNGYLPVSGEGPFPGCFSVPVLQSDKHHLTGKPTELMQALVQCVPRGGTILDPFMGSGTTGVAAILEDRNFIGIELDPTYHAIAARRIAHATRQPRLFPVQAEQEPQARQESLL